jgi:hypothetical protein
MKQNKQLTDDSRYNEAVRHAHGKILQYTQELIATLERDELRCYYERIISGPNTECIRHEIISPFLYLQLYAEIGGRFSLRFGIKASPLDDAIADLTSFFLRGIFRATDKANTAIDIEGAVDTSWFINVCAEVYEWIDRGTACYTIRKLPYKAAPAKKILVLPNAIKTTNHETEQTNRLAIPVQRCS